MATINERKTANGTIKYRAKVRMNGLEFSKTFARKTDAKEWIASTETKIREGELTGGAVYRKKTLSEAVAKFKKQKESMSAHWKNYKFHFKYLENNYGKVKIENFTPAKIAEIRDRLKDEGRSNATVNRYLSTLSSLFNTIVKEWMWLNANPCRNIKKLREDNARERFLTKDEISKLLAVAKQETKLPMYPILLIAVRTGMRRGEILNLKWTDIDYDNGLIIIQRTKNGDKRSVPLTLEIKEALEVYGKVRRLDTQLVFPSPTKPSVPPEIKNEFANIIAKAEITDFRFHDLRHTAASYMAMSGASLLDIASILGHRTMHMVKRYSHLTKSHERSVIERMNQAMIE